MASDQNFRHASTISVIRYAWSHGMAEKEIQKILNMDLTHLDLSRLSLAPEQVLRLVRAVSEKNKIAVTGLHTIKYAKISDFGIAGYVLMNCRDMGQVLEKYRTYYTLMGNVTHLTTGIVGENVEYSWRPINELPEEIERMVMEYLVASTIAHSYDLTGRQLPLKEVEFSWSAPDDLSAYTHLLGARLSFDKPCTALYFDKSYLNLPVRTSNSELLAVFENHARERYSRLLGCESLSNKVTRLLANRITCLPKMESLAKELNMSPRSFQLNLKEEGTTYLELRDAVRFQYAKRALELDRRSAAEIGLELGFSEPSAFFRAFKRWSGKTPGMFCKAGKAF